MHNVAYGLSRTKCWPRSSYHATGEVHDSWTVGEILPHPPRDRSWNNTLIIDAISAFGQPNGTDPAIQR